MESAGDEDGEELAKVGVPDMPTRYVARGNEQDWPAVVRVPQRLGQPAAKLGQGGRPLSWQKWHCEL
jgi:hypothetical protein